MLVVVADLRNNGNPHVLPPSRPEGADYVDVDGDNRTTLGDLLEIVDPLRSGVNLPAPELEAELANDTGASSSDGVTADPRVAGAVVTQLLPETRVVARVDNGPWVRLFRSDAGAFLFNPELRLDGIADGAHTVQVIAQTGGSPVTTKDVPFTLASVLPADAIVLEEGDRFTTESSVDIDLGQMTGSRTLRFTVAAGFDTTDSSSILGDQLLVYLVDPNNPSQTLLDRGEIGTTLFALSAERADFPPGLVRYDGTTVEIDLTQLGDLEQGKLRFQLLNGDDDDASRVIVHSFSNQADVGGTPSIPFAPRQFFAQRDEAVNLAELTPAEDVHIDLRNVRLADDGQLTAELRLRNEGSGMGSQAAVVFTNLPAGVTLVDPSGMDGDDPYLNLQSALPSGGLSAGAESQPVVVRFNNPDLVRFPLQAQVLSGGANRAPVFAPVGPLSVMPGGRLKIPLAASDPDGDSVTFSIRSDAALPTGALRSDATLVFTPAPDEIGEYLLTLVASDGAAEATQDVMLAVTADPVTTTRISGMILDVDQTPLAGMQVEIGGVQGLTQSDGSFTLDLGAGPPVSDTLKVRGELFSGPLMYPFIAEKLPLLLEHDVFQNVNNVIDRPIFLPPLDIANGMQVDPMQDTMVTTAAIPGASVFVEAGTLMNQQGTPFNGVLSITEVPVDLTPAALPGNLLPGLVVTIQPGEMVFASPAPLSLPNVDGWPAGTTMDLWSINPVTGFFDNVGQGQVTSDGQRVETISGGVRNSSWHFFTPPDPPPDDPDEDDHNEDDQCEECKAGLPGGSEVEAHSGALREWHNLVSYQSLGMTHGLTLHYDSERANPNPTVHFGYSNVAANDSRRLVARLDVMRGDFRLQLPGNPAGEFGLPGGENFWRITAGDIRAALQPDLSSLPSGAYDYELTSGLLQFNNGMFTGATSEQTGRLLHVNGVGSIFGNGWGLGGLLQIVENPDGSVLLIDGDGGEQFFAPPAQTGDPFVSPPGDFTQLVKQPDGSFQRTWPDATLQEFSADGFLTLMRNRNNNETRFEYAAPGKLTKMIDPVGLETTFVYDGEQISQIIDPVDRITRLEHDATGNLTRVVDPDGSERVFEYDVRHLLTAETTKRGFREEVFYNFAGQVVREIMADGTEMLYDVVQSQVLMPSADTLDPNTAPVVHGKDDALARFSDANGNVTEFTLDKAGQRMMGRDGRGRLPTLTRGDENLVQKETDARGFVTDYDYDARGNVISKIEDVATGMGMVIALPYDQPGEPVIRANAGFQTGNLPGNDDGSTSLVPLGFTANFFGADYTQLFVNNNGNVTFDSSLSEFTPFNLLSTNRVILAPFFADVDTRGVGTVTFGQDTVAGRPAFGVNWTDVGYFSSQTDKRNTFQMVLVDRSDVAAGAFDFEFNYQTIQWEAGSASGGSGGLGGDTARAGYSNGSDRSFEFDGSDVDGGLLDTNDVTGLIHNLRNSVFPGRYRFEVRDGEVQRARREFEYDPVFSQVTRSVDELGREARQELDPATGNPLVQRRVVGELDDLQNGETDDIVTTYIYTPLGLIDSMTDPLGRVTDYEYDEFSRLIAATYALGTADEATVHYEYDAAGNRTAEIDENGHRTEYVYDAMNRITRTIQADPDGGGPLTSPASEWIYDAQGNLISTKDALGHISVNEYDPRDRMVRTAGADPDGDGPLPSPTVRYTYDPAGNTETVIDALGHVTRYAYDSRNRQVSMTDPDGGVTRYGYDSDDNLALISDPASNVTRYIFDARNRLIQEADPLGKITTYVHDAANNLVAKVDRNGRETDYTYDDVNRLQTEEWIDPGDVVLNTVNYTYDAARNLLSVMDGQSALTFTYDARNRVQSVDNQGTSGAPRAVLTYSYDDLGNVLDVVDSINGGEGAATAYVYDALNRLTQLTQSGPGLADKRVDFTYNALGQYAAVNRFSNLAGTQLVVGSDYTYDGQNRFTRIDHQNAQGLSLAFYDYAYDFASRIAQLTDVDGATNYNYDARDQLTSADHSDVNNPDEQYHYDANGNRLESHLHESGYQTGPGNRLLTDGTYGYQYDDEGNLIQRTEIESGATREFQWDHRNRLTAVIDKDAVGDSTLEVRFTYDALNRRIAKAVDTTPADAVDAAITHFVYDREDVILDFIDEDGSGAETPQLAERYLHGRRADEVLAQDDAQGVIHWLLTDRLGSARDLVDGQGVLANHLVLDAYGQILSQTSVSAVSRFVFAGRELDAETDLYYLRSRYYDASTGRFTQEDHQGFLAGDPNLYRYVFNIPVLWTDPFGEAPGDQTFGLPRPFWNWYHRQVKRPGDPDLTKEQARELHDQWKDEGEPNAEGKRTKPPKGEEQDETSDENDNNNNSRFQCQLPDWLPWWVIPTALVGGGLALGAGTIIEDFVTGGAGVADDPASLGAAGTMIGQGMQMFAR